MADLGGDFLQAIVKVVRDALTYGLPFLIVLTIVVFFHELGHFMVARLFGVTVEAFSIGFGRKLVSWVDKKGTVWKIGWLPLGGYVKFLGDEGPASVPDQAKLEAMRRDAAVPPASPSPTGRPRLDTSGCFHFKPLHVRAAVVAAGPIANFLLAIVVFAGLLAIVGEERVPPVVSSVVASSPAEKAGFKAGDMVVEFDGRTVSSFGDIQEIVNISAGRTLPVEVKRDGQLVRFTVVPEIKSEKDRFGNMHNIGRIGLVAVTDPKQVEHVRYDPVTALWKGTQKVGFIIRQTVLFLQGLVVGQADTSQLSGPIGIAKMSGEMAQVSLAALFYLVGALSVSVGFINLIPIPMLDGGHLLYYAYEAVKGRPLGERAQELGFRLGLVLVISLMVFATWNDLVKLRP